MMYGFDGGPTLRFNGIGEIYSALYVDFDNIYTRLYELAPSIAQEFGTNPKRWIKWIEGHAVKMLYGENIRRRIIKRVCYLNPRRYQEYRSYFTMAGFQVVDCPPMTRQEKTSTDIHLVMDCLDALHHTTHFSEFIILSGDSDFTPLLLRLQEHARKTLILSVGYTSPAYAAAASWRVREDWFITQTLEKEAPFPTALSTDALGEASTSITNKAVDILKKVVNESSQPVPIANIGQILQREIEAGPDWFGYGKLRDFLDHLELAPLEFSPTPPGYLFDPYRHERPEDRSTHDAFRMYYPELFDFALGVHRLTDMPLLLPEHYRQILGFIVEDVNNNGFFMTNTSRNVRDRCIEAGLPIARAHVNFVLVGIGRGGYPLNEQKGVNIKEVTKAFLRNAYDLCRMSQMELGEREQKQLMAWIMPKETFSKP